MIPGVRGVLACPLLRIALALVALFLGVERGGQHAWASHFRFGHYTWTPAGGTTIEFTLQNGFRRDGYSCINPSTLGGVPCTGADGLPGPGDVFVETIGGTTFSPGDGSVIGSPLGALLYLVTSINQASNWLFALALDPTRLPALDTTITHTYPRSGDFLAFTDSCCRISAVAGVNAHINNPDGGYRVETLVNVSTGNSSPVSNLPPIVLCPQAGVCSFTVPASEPDRDALRFRLSTPAEASSFSDFNQPGPPEAPNSASIDSSTGVYTWNTTGATRGPAGTNTLYSTQVTIEDLDAFGVAKSKVAVDFFIQLVPTVGAPPVLASSLSPACGPTQPANPGSTVRFTMQASDADARQTVSLSVTGVPAGVTFTPVLPTQGNPVNSTFSWTPTVGQVGIHVMNFTATDDTLQSTQCIVTVEVLETPISARSGRPASGASNPTGAIAEPVNTATGSYVFQRTDLIVPGRGLPVIFTRTSNSLDTFAGPFGPGWTHAYNIVLTENLGGTVTIKQADGRDEFYDPLGGGNFAPRFGGIFSTLVKNPDGTFTLTLKNQTQYQFTASGKLTSITDRNDNALVFTYDGAGNLTTITDTVGRTVTLTYDASNRITQLTDPIGRTVRYGYDTSGNLASVTDQNGGVMTFVYDANRRIAEILDQRGTRLVANTYDSAGRVATQTNGRGFTMAFAYGIPRTGDTTITDPLGNVIIHTHDNQLRLIRVTDANGNVVAFAYDANNNRTSITDQNGNVTRFTYDASGNVTAITDPTGNAIALTYDGQNNLTRATNAQGFATTFAYDAVGNLTTITDAAGNTTAFTYDSVGHLIRRTDARGNTTQYSYDAQGNVTSITDALGGTTTLSYDGIGRLLGLTDPSGHAAAAGYDANSRLSQIVDPLGNTTRFAYDPVGNLIEITDAKGNRTQYGYDTVNNLTAVTDALGNITRYAYDANNNRITLTDSNGHATTYTFDAVNRLTRITDILGNTTAYTYDAVSNIATVSDPNGATNTFTYDTNNRLTRIAYGDGSAVTYTYDANGNRVSMVDQRGTTTYTYDAVDRLVGMTHPDSSVVGYGYDAVGNRTTLTYLDSKTVTYAYDALNRLTQVTDREGKETRYTYDAASSLLTTAYPNGTGIQYGYDVANRLLSVVNRRGAERISSFTYTLDALGNRVAMVRDGTSTTAYGYDALSQLISVTEPSGTRTDYAYDPVGNLLSTVGPPTRFSAADSGTTQYTYDTAYRLLQVTRDSLVSTYKYDGDGNKVEQAVGGTTRRFTNDVATLLPVILTESRPEGTIHYVYGLGLISQTGPDFQHFYHYDGLGSVVNLTGSSGNAAATYAYDPWGALGKEDPALTVRNRFLFTGEERDTETGLYYLRARWYDPSVGRFLSRDPIDEGGAPQVGHQRYAYAGNNPLTYVDPSGLTVYVASSRVASVTPFAHTYLIIEPSANTQQKIPLVFGADAPFRFGTAGALSYITISGYAGNVGELPWYVGGGRLPFTRGNLELFYGIEERNASVMNTLIAAPSGMTDTQFELLLLLAAESYRPVRYGATSTINYNSNSLASGLLAAAGRRGVQIPGLDVGWGNPVPISLETSRIREILRVSGGQTQRMK